MALQQDLPDRTMLKNPSQTGVPVLLEAERQRIRQRIWTGWFLLALLLISNTPLFLCMPIIDDAALWDLQARNILDGGVQYRDILETNPPGNLAIHVTVRSLFGWSSVALRAFDLALFAVSVLLLINWLRKWGLSSTVCIWTATVCLLYYYSISEWSHCQRDMWMLVPALVALYLRCRQIERFRDGRSGVCREVLWAAVEGVCWGVGIWIKPMIVVPALICWLAGVPQVHRSRDIALDLAGLLSGGLLIGAIGVAWLQTSGAAPYFVDTFLTWNPQYISAGRKYWTAERFAGTFIRFFPWLLLHIAAVAVALWSIARSAVSSQVDKDGDVARIDRSRALFAAFYLAWLAQSFLLQLLYDYVHAPGVLLAIAMLAGSPPVKRMAWRRIAIAGFLTIAFFASPVIHSDRLSCWWECVTQGSTPAVRDQLKLLPTPKWQDMQRVAEYLREQGVRDGEVTCYNNCLVHLYLDLGLRPPTRFVFLEQLFFLFPDQVPTFLDAFSESPRRYVVTDLVASGLSPEDKFEVGSAGPLSLPPDFPRDLKKDFPWSYPIVFRSGSILVHDTSSSTGRE